MIVHRSAAGNVGASQKNGFSVLELLVIVVIVCAIAAIGIPTLHVKAKSSILYANFHSLANLVQTDMLERSGSATTGGGNSGVRLADGLEVLLRGQKARQRFVNSCAGRETASVIVNSSSIPRDPSSSPPAVFITDDAQCRYEVFDAQSYELSRRYLVGALLVQMNATQASVDIFYVDAKGNKSADLVRLPGP